jgi:hypothetical protein
VPSTAPVMEAYHRRINHRTLPDALLIGPALLLAV